VTGDLFDGPRSSDLGQRHRLLGVRHRLHPAARAVCLGMHFDEEISLSGSRRTRKLLARAGGQGLVTGGLWPAATSVSLTQ